ncbi:MAG TPA: type II toxin-antitoxin system VapC family toxin [Opitutaceae bacterium]|nr:type II toxin-antitoxin system VapC family toxin [Opitutaceae bacterium]
MIFCDTSALAKFYVQELETADVRKRIEEEDVVCVSELVRVELMAVFHRRLREAKWSPEVFQAAIQQFLQDDIGGYWTWHPLDGQTIEAASKVFVTLPTSVFLRSADCIHLVTAMLHNHAEVFTYDTHQTTAAVALGLIPVTATSTSR